MNAPRLILILLVLSGFVFAVNVNSCQNIGISGVYDLTTNLAGEPTAADDIFVNWDACLKVSVSDVIIDCHGFTITGTTRSDTMGIGLLSGRNNVTIRNCPNITNYDNGIFFRSSSDIYIYNSTMYDNDEGIETFPGGNARVTIEGSRAIGNTWGGFDFNQDDYVYVNNCTLEDSYIGISCQYCEHGIFTNNIGRDHTAASEFAIQEYEGYNNTWEDSVFYNNYQFAIFLNDAENITVRNNTIYNNTQDGIQLSGSTNYSTIENNVIYDVNSNGIELTGTSNNNNFIGNSVNGPIYGYYLSSGTYGNNFTGNNATNTTQPAFRIISSTGNVFEDNMVYSASVGFSVRGDNNTVDGNTVNDCASGVEVEGAYNNIIRNNNVWDIGNQGYWSLGGATNNTFINNTARNTSIGFDILGSDNYLADNTAYDMTGFYGNGFQVFGSDDVYENNTAYNNQNNGFFIAYTSDVNLSDNLAYGNNRGIHIQTVNNTRLSGDRMYNNIDDLYVNGSSAMHLYASNIIFDRAAGDLTNFTNLSITDVSAVGAPTVYSVDWSSNSTVPPAPSFEGKLVDITSITATSPIDSLVWHWTDAESAAYNEATFVILKYNGSWSDEGATLNQGANTLTLTNVNPASDYGIFGNATGISSCVLIDSPGEYNLSTSISGAPFPIGGGFTCILINATQDVLLDCNGYSVSGTVNATPSAIAVKDSTNVTVQNCNMSGSRGLRLDEANDSIFQDNTIYGTWSVSGDGTNNQYLRNELYPTGSYGFFRLGNFSYYAYNNVYAPAIHGFSFGEEEGYNVLEHNNVYNSGALGFDIESNGNNLTNNTVHNATEDAFRIDGNNGEGNYNRLVNNLANGSGDYGFIIEEGDHNLLSGCIAQNGGDDGFQIDDTALGGTNNTIANSTSSNNTGHGFSSINSNQDLYFNCTAFNNTLNGFFFDNTSNTNLTDCNATDNGRHGVEMNNSNNNIIDPSYFVGNSLTGMTLFNSSNIYVYDSFFIGNVNHGIELAGDTYDCLIDNNTLKISSTSLIEVQGSSNDNNFTNNRLNGTLWGVYAASGTGNNTFRGNNATNTTQASFKVVASSNVFEDNLVYSASVGFSINGNNNTIEGNTVNDCASGIEVEGATDTIVRHNTVFDIGNQGYWSLGGATDSTFINNTAQNTSIGFEIYGSDNYLADNTAYDNTGFYGNGFHVFGSDDVYENNTAYDNANSGFFIAYTSDVNMSDNLAYGNSQGILVRGVNNTRLERDRMYGNTYDLYLNGSSAMDVYASNIIFDSAGGTLTNFTNLSFTDTVAASSEYTIDWDSQPAALAGAYIPFENKWADISTQAGAVSIDSIIWHWTDSEAASYDESRLELLMHNGSWNYLNDTPDTGSNELSLSNLNPASTYGLAALNASTCMLINAPGSYVQLNNLEGAPFSINPVAGTACIAINSSDVIYDCDGYSITNNGTAGTTRAILASLVTNVTIINCPSLSQYQEGLSFIDVNDSVVSNSTAHNNTQHGFALSTVSARGGSNNNIIMDSTAHNNSFGGFIVADGGNNNFTDNTAYDNQYGFWAITSPDNNFTDNSAYQNVYGFYIQNSPDSNFVGNDAYENSNTGFDFVGTSHRTYMEDNFAWDNPSRGFSFSTSNNTLYRNNASNSSYLYYFASSDYNNVTENNATDAGIYGFAFSISDFNIIERNMADDTTIGFYLWTNSDNSTLENNTARNNGDVGYYLTGATNNTLEDNLAYNNTNGGFVVTSSSDGNDLFENTAYNSGQYGFRVQAADSNLLINNTAYGNAYGFWVLSLANYNTLFNNTARDNTNRGFYIDANADHNELIENTAYRNSMGFATWTSSDNVTFTNNTAHSNSQYGFFLSATNNSKLYNSYAYNNTLADLEVAVMLDPLDRTLNISNFTIDNPSGGFVNYTSFDINDVAQGNTEYRVAWTSIPAALPANVDSFENKWLEIDDINGIVSIDEFVWHWTDAEAASYDESLLEVWKHDGVSYSNAGAILSEAANTLTINNLNPASDYGIVENNITYCMDITSSGLYMLNNDLAGAPISASPRSGTTCIRVSASDVIVDCMGYTIANNGTGGTTRAIVTSNQDNVTVRNCDLEEYTIGLEYYRTDNSFIDNVTSYDMISYNYYILESDNAEITGSVADTAGTNGFFVSNSNFANLTNNIGRSSGNCIYIAPNSHNSTVDDNIAHNCSSRGFYYQASRDGLVMNNLAYDNDNGFFIWTNSYGSAFDNQFINNTAHSNSYDGFYINVNRNNFTGNTAYNNSRHGFQASLSFNNFVDNEAYENTEAGFYSNYMDDSTISGLISYDNGVWGIRSRDAEDNLYADTLLYGNPRDIEVDNGGGSSYWVNMTNATFREPGGTTTNQTSMSMNDSVPTTTSNYRMSWSAQPAALPGNYSSFAGKFVEIFEAVGSVTLDSVAFHWDASESAAFDESYFGLVHHDGSWNEVPNQILDEGNNEIMATNVNDFSVYGIILYNDTNVSALKIEQSFDLPSQGGVVEFNITVNNTGNVTLNPVPVVDVLPTGLTYSAASPAPDTVASQTLTWNNVGPIGPGSAVTILLNATVDYGSSGDLENYVNVTGTPPLGDNVTAEDFENVTVYTANISVLKVDMTPLVVSPGGLVEWLINISNSGEADLDPVMVSDSLPAGFSYSAASPAADSTAGPIVWNNVGPIANGSSLQIYMNTTVAGNVSNGTYYNFVEVEGMPPNGDNVTDNDTAMIGIYAPGITVVKSAETTSVQYGSNITYVLSITNTGSVEVNLTVQDVLPGNMTFEGATVAPTSVGQTVVWDNYMALPAGMATEITYNTSVNVTGFFDNNVTVWAVPPNGNNVTDNDTLTVYVTDDEDTDPKPESKSFTIGFTSNCEGNTVKVIGASPASGFEVFVDKASTLQEVASGTTDSDGEFTFAGCGLELRILVKKSDYASETVYKTMIPCVDCELECAEDSDCEDNEQCEDNFCESVICPCGTIENHQCTEYECCLDSDCEERQSCQDNICTYECTSDGDCADTEYCEIEDEAEGGSCEDVQGMCGFAENHTWTVYECGDEDGCPDCPDRYTCQDNVCEPVLDLLGPDSGFVGEDVTVSATEAEDACVECAVRILLPDGTSLSGKTDSRGQLKVPLNYEGPYELTLFENGVPVKSIQVNSLAKPSVSPDEPDTQVIDEAVSLFLVVLLALLLVAIVYWRRRKSRKK